MRLVVPRFAPSEQPCRAVAGQTRGTHNAAVTLVFAYWNLTSI